MDKTIAEINEKIKKGKAVVFTAAEIIDYVREKGLERAAKEVDVVTTGTFGPMCSSGAYINLGHTTPKMKMGGGNLTLNGVPAYTGLAAVDIFLGANSLPEDDPRNRNHPGEFNYGGGHVIEELVAGKDVRLVASGYGTDCYPRKKLASLLNLKDTNEAVLMNPRNAYQNYNVGVNLSDKIIYTYMGILKPKMGNANFSSAGQLSPLFNDPCLKTIGIGTRIFLGGGEGYIVWQGTQHNPGVPRSKEGLPKRPAATLAVLGDLKQMSARYLVGTSMLGYGCTITVGIGVPIPILSEKILKYTTVTDADILAPVVDYAEDYPQGTGKILAEVSYAELRSGKITVKGKEIPTSSLSSYPRALEIAEKLKGRILEGRFALTEPVALLPDATSGVKMKPFKERLFEE